MTSDSTTTNAKRAADTSAGSPLPPASADAPPGPGGLAAGNGRPEAAGETTAAAAATAGGLAGDLQAAVDAARAEAAELRDAWLRARADADNVRKQAAIDREKTRKYAVETFAESLLPVRDSLEAALADTSASPEMLRSGVELTLRQLVSAFEKAQVTLIDPVGEKFDPHRHQAMTTTVAPDLPPGTVAQVFQKGYLLQDRVLRPALVSVSKAAEGA